METGHNQEGQIREMGGGASAEETDRLGEQDSDTYYDRVQDKVCLGDDLSGSGNGQSVADFAAMVYRRGKVGRCTGQYEEEARLQGALAERPEEEDAEEGRAGGFLQARVKPKASAVRTRQ